MQAGVPVASRPSPVPYSAFIRHKCVTGVLNNTPVTQGYRLNNAGEKALVCARPGCFDHLIQG